MRVKFIYSHQFFCESQFFKHVILLSQISASGLAEVTFRVERMVFPDVLKASFLYVWQPLLLPHLSLCRFEGGVWRTKNEISWPLSTMTGKLSQTNLKAYRNSWTLDAGVELWTLDTGLWTLDSGRWTLDSGLWTLDAGLWILDCGSWTLDAGLYT